MVTDSLFDRTVIQDHYPWVYRPSEFDQPTREHLIQELTIAHEVGHVIAGGLRAELHAIDQESASLESL
ncbi:MAG: hypothetical protein ACP5JG_00640 [Anaerolineae bacterium]